MATAVGQQTVFGVAEETVYGTAVVPDRFYDITSESLELKQDTIQSNALRGGTRNARLASRRQISTRQAAGSVKLEVLNVGMGRLLKHIFGTAATPVQQGATAAYLHAYSLGATAGKSLTIEKQIRDGAGATIGAFSYPGSKIKSAEFSISTGNLLELDLDIDAQNETVAGSGATPTYLAGRPFSFKQGTLKFDGAAVASVSDATVKLENAIADDRFFLGSTGLKGEQIDNGFAGITGKLSAEFFNRTQFYDRFSQDLPTALVLEFTGNVIAGIYSETLRLTVPEIHMTGESPKVGGPEILKVDVPWDGLTPANGASAITCDYITTDLVN